MGQWAVPEYSDTQIRTDVSAMTLDKRAKAIALKLSGTKHRVNVNSKGRLAAALSLERRTRDNWAKLLVVSAAVLFTAFLGTIIWSMTPPWEYDTAIGYALLTILSASLVVVTISYTAALVYISRSGPTETFTYLLNVIDKSRAQGLTPQVQRLLNRQLDQLARLIAGYPRRIRSKNANVVKVARRKALAILELHEWVSTPLDKNTYSCLNSRIERDLTLFVTDGWQALSEPTTGADMVPPRQPRRTVIGWTLFATFFLASIGLTIAHSDRLGVVAPFLVFVELLVALFGLVRAGVPVAQMKELIDVIKSVPTTKVDR